MAKITVDVAIIGSGIAGLWTFQQLRKLGYQVALIEQHAIGSEQTIASQGIIHGGLKYALQGILTPAAKAIWRMPKLWQDCLHGVGELDLTKVAILAKQQYLWSTGNIATTISSFFASKALHGKVMAIKAEQYPTALTAPQFTGKVYQLNELILAVPTLLQSLVSPFYADTIKIDPIQGCIPSFAEQGNIKHLTLRINNTEHILTAQSYIFTAGQGNAELLATMPNGVKMQTRPLHMVYVKAATLPTFYGHCIGLTATPRVTITSHFAKDGDTVWYLGGKLAEDGVNKSQSEQLSFAKQEIASLFPWLTIDGKWDSFLVNRAEACQAFGLKPETETVVAKHNIIIGWPTKLVLAPMLTKKILKILEQKGVKKTYGNAKLMDFPKPAFATLPWDN